MAADLAAFGRKVAAAQGYSTRAAGINWEAYGRAAQYAIGKGKGVPDPAKFGAAAPVAARPAPAAPESSIATVRIGAYEISRREAPLEPNRPHRRGRRGELATGHYRRRTRRSKRR
jgi:hypothetical protein